MTELNFDKYDRFAADPSGFGKALAVVFDIDGTLARHDHRGPYDLKQLMTDGVHEHIKSLLLMYWHNHYTVFIVSGRYEADNKGNDFRAMTIQWLEDNGIPYDHLFMRPASDSRNDADLKHMVFDRELRDEYNIEAWFDDRDRVVRRMRDLGVNVLQVADGNF